MNLNRHLPCALLAALLTVPQFTHAGRPLQTDDAEVLDRGACELEAAIDRLSVAGQHATDKGVALGCGIGLRTQVGVEISRSRAGGESIRSAAFVGKTSLWRGTGDSAPGLSVAWALARDKDGGRWQRTEDDVRLVGSLPVDAGFVHLNLGHLREHAPRRTLTTWGAAYEHEGFALGGIKLAPMVETFGDDREKPWLNVGLRVTLVPDRALVNLSYGRQTGDAKARLATAGVKVLF